MFSFDISCLVLGSVTIYGGMTIGKNIGNWLCEWYLKYKEQSMEGYSPPGRAKSTVNICTYIGGIFMLMYISTLSMITFRGKKCLFDVAILLFGQIFAELLRIIMNTYFDGGDNLCVLFGINVGIFAQIVYLFE